MKSRITRPRAGGSALSVAALVVVAGMTGCTQTIEGYRSLAGLNKNDPDPATAPFGENLNTASNAGYANLASVPEPPIVSSTVAERAQIAKGLNAQRTNAEAPDIHGHPGSAAPGPVPPPPPIPPELIAAAGATPPAPAPPPPPMRGATEPPVPSSPNTTLQVPQVGGPLPGAEPPRPAPSQAALPAAPAPAPSQLPAAVAQSANPTPAPPPAVLPPPPIPAEVAARPAPKLPPAPIVLASLDLSPSAPALTAADQARVADIAARYKDKSGIVRIVAYAAPGTGGAEQLNNFRAALDRAQIVAKALNGAGVPAKQIQTQAAPSSAAAPPGRIDVQLLPPATGATG
ncbi:MAG TPA: OmpA family protein [Stellaceae bacterium]|nr:OmpA family protein [Stellaceae bacterium]